MLLRYFINAIILEIRIKVVFLIVQNKTISISNDNTMKNRIQLKIC